MKTRKIFKCIFLLVLFFLITFCVFSFFEIKNAGIFEIGNDTYASLDDIKEINAKKLFGKYITIELEEDEISAGEDKITSGNIVFKIFNFIKVRKINTKIIDSKNVYLGGNLLGFDLKTSGVIVVGNTSVLTQDGAKSAIGDDCIKSGDLIYSVDERKISDVNVLVDYVNKQGMQGKNVVLKVKRGKKDFEVNAKPLLDSSTNTYKLGLWIKDDASGIGTLTYLDKDLNFGALGHPISDSETGTKVEVQEGKIYPCALVGIQKGKNGTPGKLNGVILETKDIKGFVNKSNNFGLYGKMKDLNTFVDINKTAKVGSRLAVHVGKAKIISAISGTLEEYDIEIIRASKQSKANDKSMVIKVVDERLKSKTGGVVQGMSGSPIVQDGKIIGAVTHVFVSDPTRGYGVYIDWMIDS